MVSFLQSFAFALHTIGGVSKKCKNGMTLRGMGRKGSPRWERVKTTCSVCKIHDLPRGSCGDIRISGLRIWSCSGFDDGPDGFCYN